LDSDVEAFDIERLEEYLSGLLSILRGIERRLSLNNNNKFSAASVSVIADH
jgi:hypothetical protein